MVTKLIVAPYLKEGDTVGILCTARFIDESELLSSVNLLKRWGLKIKLGNTIGKRLNQMGGTDQEKVADFQEMIADSSIKCIWCARGGYGSVRIIDNIDFKPLLTNPKWIVGFSDVTVLHSHLNKQYKLASLHAMLCSTLSMSNEESVESLRAALFGDKLRYECAPHALNITGQAKGVLCGGNLSILYSLLSSESDIDTNGKILFLEDVDEYLYHVDRMMMALKRSGKLGKLAGLIVGSMSEMKDNEVPFGKSANEIISEHTRQFSYPICCDFPAGHLAENYSLILGANVELSVLESKVCLSFI